VNCAAGLALCLFLVTQPQLLPLALHLALFAVLAVEYRVVLRRARPSDKQ
jgi:hypothetical protein